MLWNIDSFQRPWFAAGDFKTSVDKWLVAKKKPCLPQGASVCPNEQVANTSNHETAHNYAFTSTTVPPFGKVLQADTSGTESSPILYHWKPQSMDNL